MVPPAAANRRRSGTSAALWNSPPPTTDADVTIVTWWPASAMDRAVPRPRQSPRSSRTRTRPATVAAPDRTSWTETASDRSAPGRLSTSGSARWKPVPGGRAPVARTTTSAPTPWIAERSAAVPERTSTPSASSRRAYQASRSRIWPRDGCRPASRNWPPSSSSRSRSVTRCPRSAATRAASSPAGPPPTTSTDRGVAAGSRSVAVPRPFPAGRRVHEARDPVVARAAAPAQLIARDARADLVGPIGARLGDHMRVGDLPAHDADQVGLAGGQHRLGRLRRPDVALGLHDGVRDDALERGGKRDAELLLVQRDRDDRIEVEVGPGAARDVVHGATLVVPRDDLGELVHRQRRLGALVHAHREPDDEVVAARAPDAVQDRRREPHPPLERAAPRVGPAVRPRRPELIDEGVVRGEDLDPVEAGLLRPPGGRDEARDDLLDLGLGHRVAAVRVVVRRQPRRRPVRGEGVVGVAVLPDVIQLLDHHDVGVRVPTGVGQPAGNAGRSRRRRGRKLPRVRTAVRCTGTGSTTIIPAPPSARSR